MSGSTTSDRNSMSDTGPLRFDDPSDPIYEDPFYRLEQGRFKSKRECNPTPVGNAAYTCCDQLPCLNREDGTRKSNGDNFSRVRDSARCPHGSFRACKACDRAFRPEPTRRRK